MCLPGYITQMCLMTCAQGPGKEVTYEKGNEEVIQNH